MNHREERTDMHFRGDKSKKFVIDRYDIECLK